ncbi:uncharacterized protein LOC131937487 isoform X1 [Physella acuta]|uniref:uncharacterized protein LOC131937487 isoform X1 n=1 Tax=Physella acuta TaxID=109671 RepID=UPI0027DC92E8|nr:uncharacterized protein LOC131937487 isoform X1 [Physella acuta]XP_059150950.1 uncharacterized protein LOC131937487 isoform X1 [Physella acuta]
MTQTTYSKSDVSTLSSLTSCLRHCLGPAACLFLFLIVISTFVEATPHFLSDEDVNDASIELPDKRYAKLSYYRPQHSGSGRRRYDHYGYRRGSYGGGNGKYGKKAVSRYSMPWENLPNTNCLRKFCRSDDDCCRRYSKCNEQARICYDCWYGHPCQTNQDCCEKFPYCNTVLNTCSK